MVGELKMKSEFKNLPSGWKVLRLGDVCEINPSSRKLPEKFYYIDLESVEKGILHSLKEVFLETAPSRAQRLLEKGDILFQMVRPYQKNNFLFELNGDFVASTGYAQIRTKQNRDFIFQYLNFDTFTKKVIEKCTGSNYPAINASVFSNLKIPLPLLDEQEKIAEILSTWDEAINLTINLIENKKQFKKALMQNLLTAKIRFPEFQDEWRETKLGKFLKEKSDRNTENIELVLSVTNKFGFVTQVEYFDKSVASHNTANYKIVKRGNFAYNPSRINVGSIALLENYEIGILSPMYVVFECLKNLDNRFLKFWFQSHNFIGNLYKHLAGSVRESLNFKDMKTISIKLPNLKEQQKIAEVLTAFDDEINLLNLKLENLKKQKQGLMQKLLSGKVRAK
jgi:type I restriction-modification enzyme S subunit